MLEVEEGGTVGGGEEEGGEPISYMINAKCSTLNFSIFIAVQEKKN